MEDEQLGNSLSSLEENLDEIIDGGENLEEDINISPYDITLAPRHSYLGGDFLDLSGCTLHDEGSIVDIPLLLDGSIVLFPGQLLPLTVFYPPVVEMFRNLVKKSDRTVGICYVNDELDMESQTRFGTTAEIIQWQETPGIQIKAVGRQRFQLLRRQMNEPGIIIGTVKILPEIDLKSPFSEARLSSLNKFRSNKSFKRKNGHMDYASITWPRWVCDYFDAQALVNAIKPELESLQLVTSGIKLPESPEALSYWILKSLPVDSATRMRLLRLNTAVERLQYALSLLGEQSEELFCKYCSVSIGNRKDLIHMSVEGSQGTYCNPEGYVHDIITLSQTTNLFLQRVPPNSEYSWFPQYGWTIASCHYCQHHIGWRFTATNTKLVPQTFWGLSRRSLSTRDNRELFARELERISAGVFTTGYWG